MFEEGRIIKSIGQVECRWQKEAGYNNQGDSSDPLDITQGFPLPTSSPVSLSSQLQGIQQLGELLTTGIVQRLERQR